MYFQFFTVKVYVRQSSQVSARNFRETFTQWIQEEKLPGLLIDVADYTHMHHGPGVVLVAHEGNWSFDETAGRQGLLYVSKVPSKAPVPARLTAALASALQACVLVESDARFPDLRFDAENLCIGVNDRLVPASEAAFAALENETRTLISKLCGSGNIRFKREDDARRRMSLEVQVRGATSAAELLVRLESVRG